EGSGTGPSAMLRSQHAEATRRAVLAAARSLFGKKGYAQTSVDEIADAARVTKGAVYHHFAGKEALFRAVLAEVEVEAEARAAGAGDPEGPPIDAPAVLGLEPEGSVDQHPGHVDLRSFIAASTARGQIIDLDPDLLTHLIRGLVWLSGLQIAHASDPDVTRSALGEALDAMLRGLAPGTKR